MVCWSSDSLLNYSDYDGILVMHSSAKLQYSPLSVLFFCSRDKAYHKQKIHVPLYLLEQIVI